MSAVKVLCYEGMCSELVVRERNKPAYCDTHTPTYGKRKRNPAHSNHAWKKLSLKARAKQNYCLDCGVEENLSADHLPQAYVKLALNIPLTLADVEVRCLPCNDALGPADFGSPRMFNFIFNGGLDDFLCENNRLADRVVNLLAEKEPRWNPPIWAVELTKTRSQRRDTRGVSLTDGETRDRRGYQTQLKRSRSLLPQWPLTRGYARG